VTRRRRCRRWWRTFPRSTARAAGEPARELLAYFVTGNYFSTLGASAAQGRLLTARDDRPGAAPVAVISDRLWQRLGRASDATGTTLTINGQLFTVVGVAAASFVGTEPMVADVWIPRAVATVPSVPSGTGPGPDERPVLLLARLDSRVPATVVEARFSAMLRNATRNTPADRRRGGLTVARATFFPIERDPLAVGMLVLLATGLLLAATAANVSNLVLARGVARRREMAVRLAMGAGRIRLGRQLLIEVLCLTVTAGAVALLLSSWTLSALYAAALPHVPFAWGTVLLDLSPDWRVIAYAFAICLVVTLGVGLAPVLHANRISIAPTLHGAPATLGRRWGGWQARSVLVTTQVAISLALAIVAGLLARAAERAEAVEIGFDPRGVLTTNYDLGRHAYTAARAAAFNRDALERAAGLSGVTSAALASHVPLTGGLRTASIWSPERGPSHARPYTRYVFVSNGYFRTLRIPLIAGRDVSRGAAGAREAVVSEVVARDLWPHGITPDIG
jgi:predicted permease